MGENCATDQKMEEIPKNIQEAFSYAEALSIAADEKEEYTYAMHKYKSMANKFIEAKKSGEVR